MSTVQEEIKALRSENREDHKGISDRLDRLNGQVLSNTTSIATAVSSQEANVGRLDKIEASLSAAWKEVRTMARHAAMRWGYAAGAAAVVILVLQGVILPIVKKLIGD